MWLIDKLKSAGIKVIEIGAGIYVYFQDRKFYRGLKMEEEVEFFLTFMNRENMVGIMYKDEVLLVRSLEDISNDKELIDAYNTLIPKGGIVIPVLTSYHKVYSKLIVERMTK